MRDNTSGAQATSQVPFLDELVQAEVCRAERPEPAELVLPGGGKHHLIFPVPGLPAQSAIRLVPSCKLSWWR